MDAMRLHPFLHFHGLPPLKMVARACATVTLNKLEAP
jgi:hypothetical protein